MRVQQVLCGHSELRDLVVCHLGNENGPERVVWAAAPEWTIEDLPNVGIRPDRYYRPVPLPETNYLPYTGALMTVDPAGTGTDETTYTITKTLNGLVFLLDAGGFPPGQGHSPETLEGIATGDPGRRWRSATGVGCCFVSEVGRAFRDTLGSGEGVAIPPARGQSGPRAEGH